MALRQEVNTPLILTIGIVSALVLLVVVFGLDAWFRFEQEREISAKYAQAKNYFLESTVPAQKARIQATGYDTERKAYTIPIGEAMKRIVASGGKLPETRPAGTRPVR